MKTQLPTLEDLQEIDLSPLGKFLEESKSVPDVAVLDFLRPAGDEAYALYAYLSTLFDNGTILDIGTLFGSSATALSYNLTNKVISYDVNEHNDHSYFSKRSNMTWKNMDFRKDNTINWDDVKMILIDTDHTGKQETEFIEFLIEKDWSGFLILDDIHINESMHEFWGCFDDDIKVDVTYLGHGRKCPESPYGVTGSGFVEFDLK